VEHCLHLVEMLAGWSIVKIKIPCRVHNFKMTELQIELAFGDNPDVLDTFGRTNV
jgi:hypothetical protein